MAQSPFQITGLSSGVVSVYLGGLYRNLQATLNLNAGSSAPAGTMLIAAGESPGSNGREILSIGNPTPQHTYSSSVQQGFFQYVNVYTTDMSSDHFDAIVAHIYFDGSQWPSS